MWSGLAWAWPWVLALTPALLGGGSGLAALISVVMLAPGPDAHKRPDNPLEHGDTTGQANLMFWAGLLPALPAGTLLGLGTAYDNEVLLWSAIPVGVATGVLLAWWLGHLAVRRLQSRGPELLFLMRTGRPSTPVAVDVPMRAAWLAGLGWAFGSVALFPQGIVPMLFLLLDVDIKSWFLAMYVADPLAWPTATVMCLLGLWLYYVAVKVTTRKKSTPPEGDGPEADQEANRQHLELESV